MMYALMTWFDMGGYAAYIWSAYGTVFMVLLANLLQTKAEQKRTWRMLQRWVETS
jgi:heme exporter protein CcmD